MADPICTFLFSLFVLCTTFTIMRDILVVLMEGKALKTMTTYSVATQCLPISVSLFFFFNFFS